MSRTLCSDCCIPLQPHEFSTFAPKCSLCQTIADPPTPTDLKNIRLWQSFETAALSALNHNDSDLYDELMRCAAAIRTNIPARYHHFITPSTPPALVEAL